MTISERSNNNNNSHTATIQVGPYLSAIASLDKAKQHLNESILHTLASCTPGWENVELEEVVVKHLGGAMTNLIFAVSKNGGENEDVLVRVYGEGTESFFIREDEMHLFQLLSAEKIGVGLLGEFTNGRVEKMIHGQTCTSKEMRKEELSMKIAKKMRQFHELTIDIEKRPHFLQDIRRLFQIAKEKCDDSIHIDWIQFEKDIDEMEQIVLQVHSPLVLCHNDLQYGNIMKTAKEDDIVLIDFEYCSYNPRGYDLGNHFCEWAYDYHKAINCHLGDFHKYPTIEEQRRFCRAYLLGNEKNNESKISEEDIETLRLEANTYSLASHLFWALWGFIQASQSEIDFDFQAYGQCRYDAYKQRLTLKNYH
jgi:choline/ethanolamine kinase